MKTPQLPIPALSQALGIKNEIWLKREDKHHYGSHKGRSIPLMITTHLKNGVTSFFISSSGNAALAAIRAIQTYNKNKNKTPVTLHIFIGQHIDKKKKELLEREIGGSQTITITQTDNPKQQAVQLSKETSAVYLRQSTDDVALLGYEELAGELARIENLCAVFIPTSSGTTAQGLHQGFKKLELNPEIHIVQTTSCHPIVEALPTYQLTNLPAETSLATAIVDNVALRKEKVVAAIKESGGGGWIATNDEITTAIDLAKKTSGEIISPNSALALVGLTQAITAGKTWSGAVVCLITGN